MVKFMQRYEIHCFYCPLYAGLDVDKDHILEMACLITDGDMNIVAEVGIIKRTYIITGTPYRAVHEQCLIDESSFAFKPFECSP